MKPKIYVAMILIGLSLLAMSCVTQKFVPEGSKDLGTYHGRFSGELIAANGNMRLHFWKTPDGTILFRGLFESTLAQMGGIYVRGTAKDKKLKGEFDSPVHGTITGQMAEDRSQISGTFSTMELKDGTWKVDLKKKD